MIEYRLTVTDLRMALLHRGYTESQVAQLLGDIKAEAWDEAIELLQNNSEINHYDQEHYQSLNPFREQEQHDD